MHAQDKMPVAEDLYYFANEVEDNDKNRPPVILLHGAGGNHLSWPPQIRRVNGERIYALDLPGHGKSGGVGRQSINEYADSVVAFMKALKISAAVIVGISMGSAIALHITLNDPEKVLGLGLIGAGAKLRVAPTILETIINFNSFESAVDMINENCFSFHAPKNLLQLSKRHMMSVRPSVLLGDLLACNEFDVAGQLKNINIPTCIICGSEDKMMPVKFSKSLRDEIANSQLHVLDNAGHMVMLEQPDAVAIILKQFIAALQRDTKQATKKHSMPNG